MPALIALAFALQGGRWTDPRTAMPQPWVEPGYLHVEWIQSPNFGKRPARALVDTIVVHSTVIPTLKATTEAFQRGEDVNPAAVSSHFTIGKDGSIVQNVSSFARAWHAGVSVDHDGHKNVNDYSIGIELVNLNDGKDPYPPAQIAALRGIIAEMCRRFPIKQFVSHEYIAQPPGRKNDPKGFPWDALRDFNRPIYTGEHKV
jgi:N-acetyl-anhydromuramyl-L-alanine amidase AmpD